LTEYDANQIRIIAWGVDPKMRKQIFAIFTLMLCIAGCSVTPISEKGREVKIVFSDLNGTECKYVGEVYGIEANMFSYWFISGDNIINGALSSLKNNAAMLGGNVVYLAREIEFSTSTSFFGGAYNCP
jgi:hypothetical protein